jgi:hypothetical protein
MIGCPPLPKLATTRAFAHLLSPGLFALWFISCAPETAAPPPTQDPATQQAELVVEGRLVMATAVPELARIAPYRRAMATALFDLTAIREGEFPDPQILVARWVIVDDKPIQELAMIPGAAALLHLVPMEDRDDLKDEVLLDDTDEFDLPLFFALDESLLPLSP